MHSCRDMSAAVPEPLLVFVDHIVFSADRIGFWASITVENTMCSDSEHYVFSYEHVKQKEYGNGMLSFEIKFWKKKYVKNYNFKKQLQYFLIHLGVFLRQ